MSNALAMRPSVVPQKKMHAREMWLVAQPNLPRLSDFAKAMITQSGAQSLRELIHLGISAFADPDLHLAGADSRRHRFTRMRRQPL